MAQLEKRVIVNDNANYPLYRVTINSNPEDGGISVFNLTTEAMDAALSIDLDSAAQAFAASIVATSGYALVSITKTSVTETTL
jgi:hypothetical protein